MNKIASSPSPSSKEKLSSTVGHESSRDLSIGVLQQLQPMIDSLSSRLSVGFPDSCEDFLQEGALAVLTAVSRFDEMKGKVENYAARFAKGQLLNTRRTIRYRQREIAVGLFRESSANDQAIMSNWSAPERIDNICAADQLNYGVDASIIRDLAIIILTSREFRAIDLLYFQSYQLKEAATEMGISAPRVLQLRTSALEKLRNRLKVQKSSQN